MKDAKALWPAKSICMAMVEEGLAADTAPLLLRTSSVSKSAFAKPGERPNPADHYATTEVSQLLPLGHSGRIVLVDDVITRGSTLLGMYRRLREALPNAEIHCYAVVRTFSGTEFEGMLDPVSGHIHFENGKLLREP